MTVNMKADIRFQQKLACNCFRSDSVSQAESVRGRQTRLRQREARRRRGTTVTHTPQSDRVSVAMRYPSLFRARSSSLSTTADLAGHCSVDHVLAHVTSMIFSFRGGVLKLGDGRRTDAASRSQYYEASKIRMLARRKGPPLVLPPALSPSPLGRGFGNNEMFRCSTLRWL